MCIGVGAPDGRQRRERPLDGDQVGDDLDGLGVRFEDIGPAGDLVQVRPDPRQLAGALSLHLGVRHGPGARPAHRPAHQIRQR